MKRGSDNRKKTITASALGVVALICIIYAYNQLFGGPSSPPPSPAPASTTVEPATENRAASSGPTRSSSVKQAVPGGNAPGVAATKMATTSSSLDPTLDETAMLRTESLEYSGTGRNIFSAIYVPPPPADSEGYALCSAQGAGAATSASTPTSDLPTHLPADQPEVLRHGEAGQWADAGLPVAG